MKKFLKENLVLVVGLTMPVLLMLGFMLSTMIPQAVGDPPKYSMIFTTNDGYGSGPIPYTLNFVVKDGTLIAQYTKNPTAGYYSWRKLYIYDAATQKVRDISVPIPTDMTTDGIKEETVATTKDMKLDTTLQAPDGYEVSWEGYSRSGFMGDMFWGGNYSSETRLRKGGSSVKLTGIDGRTPFYYGNIQFIGWVVK